MLYFYPLQLPPSPHGPVNLEWKDQLGDGSKFWGWQFKVLMTIQSSRDDGSRACGLTDSMQMPWTVPLPWQVVRKQLWRMTCVTFRLDFSLDWSVASSSVHFFYKYHTLLFSFFHFPLKHNIRVLLSSLSKTTPFSCCIRHQRPSSVHSLTW